MLTILGFVPAVEVAAVDAGPPRMQAMSVRVAVAMTSVALAAVVSACGAAERAAAQDPMKCERDPTCSRARSSYIDCSKQCSDNPECVDRCRQMQTDPHR